MKKQLERVLMCTLLLFLAAAGQVWAADGADVDAVEATQPLAAEEDAPIEHEPNPVFLPGADAGGAGFGEARRSDKPQSIRMEDHICCPHGSECHCVYYAGFECNLFGCASGGC